MQTPRFRPHLLALAVAVSLGSVCLPAQAMTSDQALALAASANLKDAAALAQLQTAAQSGDANAQLWLGVMYNFGQGVPQDYAQALSWYRKAAEQGYADAQNNLGVVYQFGQGVPQDNIVAYALYNLSATGNPSSDNPAANNRSKLAPRMTPKQIAAGQELTRRMMKIGVLKAIDSWR